MAAQKGHTKEGGRTKGTPNKATAEARELFIQVMSGEMDNVKQAFDDVREKSPIMYLNLLSKLMPYFMPKQIDVKSDGQQVKQVFLIGETQIEL